MDTMRYFVHVPPKPAWIIDSLGANSRHLALFRNCWCWLMGQAQLFLASGNETGSENLRAYMTCKCWTGFWPYIVLARRGDLGIVTFFFIFCRDPDSLVGRFTFWLWDTIPAIRNLRVRPMSVDFQRQTISVGEDSWDPHLYWGFSLSEYGAHLFWLYWSGKVFHGDCWYWWC